MAAVAPSRLNRPTTREPGRAATLGRSRLRPPSLRPRLVERPRLNARLDALTQGALTLVGAPTGYGKTTLLAGWATSEERPLAWVSLAPGDGEASRFWMLVGTAFEQAVPALSFGLRSGLAAGRAPEEQAWLLAGALGALDDDLVLVVDGYEHAAVQPAESSFERFLELVPETVHVVLSTRHEPDLRLAWRRSRGCLGELGLDDLRLDAGEVAELVRRTAGITLGDGAAMQLGDRTEGWPAGVYLAALAARSSQRPAELLAGFSGASRDVADYLRAELLDVQLAQCTRDFLLETSVLERLSAPLCDAVLRRRDSQSVLDMLARSGSFLVPLDALGGEFRYQRMAAEFLRSELARLAAPNLRRVHRRAAPACERAGLVEEAAAHARSAGREPEALAILGRHALELVRGGRTDMFGRLLATNAGAAVVGRRPELASELERIDAARSDMGELLKASERVTSLCVGLPGGPIASLARSTARGMHAYALLMGGRLQEAYEAGSEPQAWAETEAAAAVAQATAVASLAAGRLGRKAAAGPLARASASALRVGAVRSGLAAALTRIAEAVVLAEQGERSRAELGCEAAVAVAGLHRPARALALLELARLRTDGDAEGARTALEAAQVELARCIGVELLSALAAEIEGRLASRERALPVKTELSDAEQRVLRLLATSLTQREIACELYLSPNTVKTHARVIYRKLDVCSRRDAVRAAHELNLV